MLSGVMAQRDQLKAGMTLEQVKSALKNWRDEMPSAYLSSDRTHLFYTVDFLPPLGSMEGRVRMTFDNGRLLHWGDPADPPDRRSCDTKTA